MPEEEDAGGGGVLLNNTWGAMNDCFLDDLKSKVTEQPNGAAVNKAMDNIAKKGFRKVQLQTAFLNNVPIEALQAMSKGCNKKSKAHTTISNRWVFLANPTAEQLELLQDTTRDEIQNVRMALDHNVRQHVVEGYAYSKVRGILGEDWIDRLQPPATQWEVAPWNWKPDGHAAAASQAPATAGGDQTEDEEEECAPTQRIPGVADPSLTLRVDLGDEVAGPSLTMRVDLGDGEANQTLEAGGLSMDVAMEEGEATQPFDAHVAAAALDNLASLMARAGAAEEEEAGSRGTSPTPPPPLPPPPPQAPPPPDAPREPTVYQGPGFDIPRTPQFKRPPRWTKTIPEYADMRDATLTQVTQNGSVDPQNIANTTFNRLVTRTDGVFPPIEPLKHHQLLAGRGLAYLLAGADDSNGTAVLNTTPGTGKTRVVLCTTAELMYQQVFQVTVLIVPHALRSVWESELPKAMGTAYRYRVHEFTAQSVADRVSVLRTVGDILHLNAHTVHFIVMDAEVLNCDPTSAPARKLAAAFRAITATFDTVFVMEEAHRTCRRSSNFPSTIFQYLVHMAGNERTRIATIFVTGTPLMNHKSKCDLDRNSQYEAQSYLVVAQAELPFPISALTEADAIRVLKALSIDDARVQFESDRCIPPHGTFLLKVESVERSRGCPDGVNQRMFEVMGSGVVRCGGAKRITEDELLSFPKYHAVALVALEWFRRREGSLILIDFKEAIDRMGQFLEGEGVKVVYIHGDVPAKQLKANIHLATHTGDPVVILATMEMASNGLNLQQAVGLVLIATADWSFQRMLQGVSRAARMGQPRRMTTGIVFVNDSAYDTKTLEDAKAKHAAHAVSYYGAPQGPRPRKAKKTPTLQACPPDRVVALTTALIDYHLGNAGTTIEQTLYTAWIPELSINTRGVALEDVAQASVWPSLRDVPAPIPDTPIPVVRVSATLLDPAAAAFDLPGAADYQDQDEGLATGAFDHLAEEMPDEP